MARTRELLGLIAGFATGTLLTALFISTDSTRNKKKKIKLVENEEVPEVQKVYHEN